MHNRPLLFHSGSRDFCLAEWVWATADSCLALPLLLDLKNLNVTFCPVCQTTKKLFSDVNVNYAHGQQVEGSL